MNEIGIGKAETGKMIAEKTIIGDAGKHYNGTHPAKLEEEEDLP